MCVDIKNVYLGTPLNQFKYMFMPLALFPEHTIKQHNLYEKPKGVFKYVKILKAIYSLTQAGSLANKLPKEQLTPEGYFEVPNTK